jgi:hypothetical protein
MGGDMNKSVETIEYKGHKICQNTKTEHHKHNVSGHEWSTQTPANGFHVVGKGVFSDIKFSTVEKAKEAIDFADKFGVGKNTPRSQKEIDKGKKYT